MRVGAALYSALGEDGFDIFNEWSSRSSKFRGADECHKKWMDFGKMTDIHIGTLFGMADDVDPDWRQEYDRTSSANDEQPSRPLKKSLAATH